MLCVRCKHPLQPRADRCLRCFALNPQNVEAPLPPDETEPDGKPVAKAAPKSSAKAAPKPGAKAAPKSGTRPAVGSRPALPAQRPASRPALSIDSGGPAPRPLSMTLESDPPLPLRLDFSSDPAPALGEPPSLGLDPATAPMPAALRNPFGSVPRVGGSRPAIPTFSGGSGFPTNEPKAAPAPFEEIPSAEISNDEIEAMLAAKKKKGKKAKAPALDPSEQPTERPSLAPPAPTEESEVDRLRAALDDAALDHAWGQSKVAPEGVGPFNSPAPPVLAPPAPEEEDLSGIVASDDAPAPKIDLSAIAALEGEEDLSGIVAPDDAPAPKIDLRALAALEGEEDSSGIVAADDAPPRKLDDGDDDEGPMSPDELAAMLGKKPGKASSKSDVTTPGWVAAQSTDRAFVGEERTAPGGPDSLGEGGLPRLTGLSMPQQPDEDVPVAPPASLPPPPKIVTRREIHLTPAGPDPEPVIPLPPPPPPRTTPRARLTAWTFDASLLFTAGAGFVALTAAVLGRPRLAPLGRQSPDSWADQLLFGHNLPLFWTLLLLTLGVAYSWLFASLGGRTPGMQLAGLRLRRLDGGLPGPGLGLAHALLALPSLLGLFGFLSALFDPKCRTLHDKLLGVVVEPDE